MTSMTYYKEGSCTVFGSKNVVELQIAFKGSDKKPIRCMDCGEINENIILNSEAL